jgi:hypothetical protein
MRQVSGGMAAVWPAFILSIGGEKGNFEAVNGSIKKEDPGDFRKSPGSIPYASNVTIFRRR